MTKQSGIAQRYNRSIRPGLGHHRRRRRRPFRLKRMRRAREVKRGVATRTTEEPAAASGRISQSGEGNSEDSGFRRERAPSHTDTYTRTHVLVHCRGRVMHIRRLLGNGFGLLMTGQLS